MAIIGEKSKRPILVGMTLLIRFKNGFTIEATNLPKAELYKAGTNDIKQYTNKINSYNSNAQLMINGSPLTIRSISFLDLLFVYVWYTSIDFKLRWCAKKDFFPNTFNLAI